jgi:Zn-dependent M28 family amino/carboxypeptidase
VLAQQYLQQRFISLGLTAVTADYRQPFDFQIGFSKHQGVNLIAKRQGCRYPQLYIVVTAHYDHLAARGRQIFNGADDNASGVAGLLYLAGLLQQQCPAYSYLFVATDAEEHGLDGAKAFLATPPVPQSQMVLNINLDMIGRGEKRNRLYLLGKRTLPNIVNMPRAEQDGVNLILASQNRNSGRGNARVDWSNASDHGAFRRAGIPYLYFGVDVHPDYHTPDDDWQRIQPEFLRAALEHISTTVLWLEQQTPAQLQYPRPLQEK